KGWWHPDATHIAVPSQFPDCDPRNRYTFWKPDLPFFWPDAGTCTAAKSRPQWLTVPMRNFISSTNRIQRSGALRPPPASSTTIKIACHREKRQFFLLRRREVANLCGLKHRPVYRFQTTFSRDRNASRYHPSEHRVRRSSRLT